MSDFDDEPGNGSPASGGDDGGAVAPSTRPRRRPRPEADDLWDDDAPAPKARAKRSRPAEDEWDDAPAPKARAKKARPADDDDDWDDDWDDDRGGGKRDLTLVFAIAAAVLVIALVVVLTRPKDDDKDTAASQGNVPGATQPVDAPPNKNWQGPIGDAVGEAEARIAQEDGVFIWTGFDGWHIRNKTGQEVTVVITAPKVVETADGSPKGDFGTELTLTVPSGDGTSGSDFDLSDSEQASISVKQGETPVPADQIKLGGSTGVATANPVELTKA